MGSANPTNPSPNHSRPTVFAGAPRRAAFRSGPSSPRTKPAGSRAKDTRRRSGSEVASSKSPRMIIVLPPSSTPRTRLAASRTRRRHLPTRLWRVLHLRQALFPGPSARTRRSPLLPDQLPGGSGPSERSDELDLGRFALIRVTRRSPPFPQSASHRLVELRPRCSSRRNGTTVSTSACALRLARVDGVGEAEVGEHERRLAVLAAHDHHVAHYAAT